MTGQTAFDPSAAASAVTKAILADLGSGSHRGVVVDSPPGAGKSTLVVTAALALVAANERCMIVAQTNNQVNDLLVSLRRRNATVRLGRLNGQGYQLPEKLLTLPNVKFSEKADALLECDLVIATAAKWARVEDGHFAWAIVDEAYQMRSDMLLLVASRFDRALFVGDPGQLDPFTIVETERGSDCDTTRRNRRSQCC